MKTFSLDFSFSRELHSLFDYCVLRQKRRYTKVTLHYITHCPNTFVCVLKHVLILTEKVKRLSHVIGQVIC